MAEGAYEAALPVALDAVKQVRGIAVCKRLHPTC